MKRLIVLVLALLVLFSAAAAEKAPFDWESIVACGDKVDWRAILQYYRDDPDTCQIIFVKYTGGSEAEIQVYLKDPAENNAWTKALVCDGLVGRNGAGFTHEGGGRTPIGVYGVSTAFGIKANPGTTLPYVDVTPTIFCCDEDGEYYNRIIDTAEVAHDCHGEEMYKYSPEYNYGMFMDYNAECTPGKGSAIFFHCDGPRDYTGGCVAVAEENMKWILQHVDSSVKVCVFDK